MKFASRRVSVALLGISGLLSAPASAQLYWKSPDFRGLPVTGTEPGIVIPLPGATSQEVNAELVWTLRAGLNFAALQCQFAPSLMTVANYNQLLTHHSKELATDYKLLQGYFKRTAGKGATQNAINAAFDSFNTRSYSSFSTVYAQRGFCQTASSIGQSALMEPKGSLQITAHARLRELRNSLQYVGDIDARKAPPIQLAIDPQVPAFPPTCFDRRGDLKKKCMSRD
ncbi:hypothetical protein HZF05_17475 [Sphingomonas sp. CGMCC 1.13654]|uniref:Uncharacterized protein n=1 Tax=Sphingomonas chungangi TaxID=2683589 RepID=A0A838L9L5_9SPHN|nr:hypothetical protein [Sphingomonas chungangi]MBA2935874.1 hypothetical protein [Sphingomonas chungangi]MVW54565.1 hypothetical protein [Sphingomonas chungangi]